MANNEQIRSLIRKMIKEEVQAILPDVVAEVFSGMITESVKSTLQGNSHKRRVLQEASMNRPDEMDEYPTMNATPGMSRERMAELMGISGAFTPSARPGEMIVSQGVTEHGTAFNVNPATLPDHVVNALTRDYRDVMNKINKKNGG
jgi:hypothetical protein